MIEQEVKAYTKSNIYDYDLKTVLTAYPKRILEILESEHKYARELKCLDLGLGQGYSNTFLEENFNDYTVLDGDARIIALYKENHPTSQAKIIETFFENFETNEKYDVIIMGFILEHVERPVECLSKYKQFLKSGGIIYCCAECPFFASKDWPCNGKPG